MIRAGMPTAMAPSGTASRTSARGADHRTIADRHAVEDLGARAQPCAGADPHARRGPRLLEDRARRVGEVVIAADDVAIRGEQGVAADPDLAGREDLTVEADVRAVFEIDVAVLARQDGVAADEHTAADRDAAVGVPLRIQQAVVVDDHVITNADLLRMPHDDAVPEHDVAAAGAEQ